MPCYRCGARQVDPGKGPSPWGRGVANGQQVLVCPECQRTAAWQDGLDRCAECGSVALVVRLGEVTCRGCGRTWAAAVDSPAGDPALAAEVSAALDRLFGRTAQP
jgi:hypothetical protein